jgi:hypothetical protein
LIGTLSHFKRDLAECKNAGDGYGVGALYGGLFSTIIDTKL